MNVVATFGLKSSYQELGKSYETLLDPLEVVRDSCSLCLVFNLAQLAPCLEASVGGSRRHGAGTSAAAAASDLLGSVWSTWGAKVPRSPSCALSHPFFGWEGSPTNIDCRKKLVPLFYPDLGPLYGKPPNFDDFDHKKSKSRSGCLKVVFSPLFGGVYQLNGTYKFRFTTRGLKSII